MAQDNATLLLAAYEARIREYKQHCLDRENGKERLTYSLNGRNFNWTEYEAQILDSLERLPKILAGLTVAYAETRGG